MTSSVTLVMIECGAPIVMTTTLMVAPIRTMVMVDQTTMDAVMSRLLTIVRGTSRRALISHMKLRTKTFTSLH
jgi:hypothetical protein